MAQYGRPNSDIRTGIFSPSTGATLWGCIDETTPSDADFISGGGSADYAEVGLSSVTDPTSSTGHFVNYRIARNPTNRAITLVVRLMQGATEIASWSHVNYNGPGTFNAELSGAQADAITNYGALSLRFDVTSSHASGVSFVYWAEFEVPDIAGSSVNALTGTGQLVFTGYAPTVTATDHKNILTSTGELLLEGQAPTVSVSDNKNILTGTGELSLTGYAPTVSVSDHKNIVTATGELVLAGFAPTVSVSQHVNVITATGEMIITGYAPSVGISGQTKYLVTKTGYYVTYNNMLITIDSDVAGDILMLQEGVDGSYTELELTSTTTPPTFT